MAKVISANRRGGAIVTFLLLGVSLASAGHVTATYPLPKPVTVGALQQDTAGNVYLAGYTGPTQGSPPASSDAFVAKLSSAGTVLFWTTFGRQQGGLRARSGHSSRRLDRRGWLYRFARFSADARCSSNAVCDRNDGTTGFFVRLDAVGKVRYSSYLNTNLSVPPGSPAPQFSPTGLTLDAAGAAYISGAGSFASTPGALPTVANAGWILKLDASGKIVFGTGFMAGGWSSTIRDSSTSRELTTPTLRCPRLLAPFRRQSRRGSKAFVRQRRLRHSLLAPIRRQARPYGKQTHLCDLDQRHKRSGASRDGGGQRGHRNGGRHHGIQRLSRHAGSLPDHQLHDVSSQRHHLSLRRSARTACRLPAT